MLRIINQNIRITRGDSWPLTVSFLNENEDDYEFQANDVIRLSVTEADNVGNVVLQKDTMVPEICTEVDINLTSDDTTIGELINEEIDYWYQIVLNPDTEHKTVIGYDENPALFTLLPDLGGKK